jgi:1-acyl-sn-glycerol-3-phosphate acyltransferase
VWRGSDPILRFLARWWIDFRVMGPDVAEGPAVVAANHFAHVDPVIVSLTVGRPMRFLALDELYGRSRLFDALTLWLGAIPVSRTRPPLGALRTSLAELDAGGTVGLFPEGARVAAWGDRALKRGAAWLALRAGVPLVPVAVAGTDAAMDLEGGMRIRRRPVIAVVCEPIAPTDVADHADPVTAMTAEWAVRIGDALDEAHRELGRE